MVDRVALRQGIDMPRGNEGKIRDMRSHGAGELSREKALVAHVFRRSRSLRVDLLGRVRKVVQRRRLLAREEGQGKEESCEEAAHDH
jgi:hypothetical protein